MTRIRVRVSSPNYYSVRRSKEKKLKVLTKSGIIMARKLSDLMDVDTSNVQDNYVMLYDASTKKYRFYDPDDLISKSLIDGLPDGFMDYLNQTLVPESLITATNQIYDFINSLTLGRLANVKESVDLASDTFIIRYDEVSGKYEAVDPDEILSSAVDENGLPADFINYLNQILIPEILSEALQELTDNLKNLTLGELSNVSDVGTLDKYVIMYDESNKIYKTVNPDEVLKATVEETTQDGLPEEFLQQLDTDLDNRIDVDAGAY